MVGAIPLVVILNDVLYAHESLFVRLQVLDEVAELAVCSTPAAIDLVVIVTMCGYNVGNKLVCDHVFPVCAGGYAAIEHSLRGAEVASGFFKYMPYLCVVSDCRLQSGPSIYTE